MTQATTDILKAPFPWFGGKSRVAHLVWERFGNVPNYVEPFFGSGAVFFARPSAAKYETLNDLNCYVANFFRALKAEPEAVAEWASDPINEADLHARHRWLIDQADFRERMMTDPDFHDVKIAGWWVWGLCQWIGDAWCDVAWRGRPDLSGRQGIFTARPHVARRMGVHRKRPALTHRRGVRKLAHRADALIAWFEALAARLSNTAVCCGDWTRVVGDSPTIHCASLTGVFLDPPYGDARADTCYTHHDRTVASAVAAWALERGDDKRFRIAVCGYEGEHAFPETWECIAWKAGGGYARKDSPGAGNRHRERIWFSPHCLKPKECLF